VSRLWNGRCNAQGRSGKDTIEEIPELKGITDVTDHSYRENAYYK